MRYAFLTLGLACGLLLAMALPPSRAQAQSDPELKALNAQVIELYRAGKFAEAIPLAERFADAVKARSGPDHREYATALNNLAQLLHDTSRFGEAEPLMRRALAIDEKSGPEHPRVDRSCRPPSKRRPGLRERRRVAMLGDELGQSRDGREDFEIGIDQRHQLHRDDRRDPRGIVCGGYSHHSPHVNGATSNLP
jgi:hypothetical protein